MDSILNYNQAQQGQNQSAQQQQQQGGLGGGLMDLASQLMGQSGGGFDLKALLAGANMQHGNPHDLEKPMTNVLSSIQTVQRPDAAVDESALAQAHQQAYNNGHANPTQAHQLSTEGMGAAAAIQAFKDFAGAGTRQAQEGPGHQSLISKLLGMAMSEAVKLFQKSGGAADGGSEADVMSAAGQALMKLLIQNQVQGALGGGTGSGGNGPNIGQLMSIASKFMAK
ncbi:hypothetical protein CC85DRAFT_291601 [Cutaneotrichosporon oleaginosum]|uniref:DUF7721 domain-containing protein n=1 Tax=Cutaneotrichosporon oleaginosum TaxID=879819 RepID=A0A0J0XQD5_9TREE|nr:uncharacterized protein CC85DRAFT_291601 [Cutaneotrichosporon oleaginosum]KLT43313.1 hypothetical protein CC85DRAFT_291601 [Cutaneotrichosporon oleaginosum]TXT14425.1 hypothetical protein COLE_00618 [Cutaneotrichosporon oleaginosum]